MLNVKNKGVIKRLNRQNLKANKQRNGIAIGAIVLTTMLFVAIFSAVSSVNASFQEQSFRQVGGYAHAGLKYVSRDMIEQMKDDPMLAEYGIRLGLGMPTEAPFHKSHVEVSYMDETHAKLSYSTPQTGRLPEREDELATDTRVLDLLGIPHELGQTVSFSYALEEGEQVTDTFTLVGWWEYDPASVASMVLVSEDYAEGVLGEYGYPRESSSFTGTWSFDFMFRNSYDIEGKLDKLLIKYGYQTADSKRPGYVDTGINWGYTSAKLSQNIDVPTLVMILALVLLVYWAGYLIIYNIFRISVGSDIRFYGMLKTIGTTGKQTKAMVRSQAAHLMIIGIPVGVLLGVAFGSLFAPVIMNGMNVQATDTSMVWSVNPALLLLAVLLSAFTVLSSCRRPARIAAGVSPMEALRYQEETGSIKKRAKKQGRSSLFAMAWSSVGRNKGKTAIVILSLALSVLLLNVTVAFVSGFDMDRFTAKFTTTDFVVSQASYFQYQLFQSDTRFDLSEDLERLFGLEGVDRWGRVYANLSNGQIHYSEEQFRMHHAQNSNMVEEDTEYVENRLQNFRDERGRIRDCIDIYGMDPLALEQLKVVDGDPAKLNDSSGKYIVYVVDEDDYGHISPETINFQVGDEVTITYDTEGRLTDEKIYTIAAMAVIPYGISTRIWVGNEAFVLSAKQYLEDVPDPQVMLGVIDASEDGESLLEESISDYVEHVNPGLDYESKGKYQKEFYSFKNMFLMLGVFLSVIIGVIGILNFFNTTMSGINARRRELAIMQAVGMTTEQTYKMLVYEGMLHTGGAVGLSLLLIIVTNPLLIKNIGNLFWFITPKFTIWPPLVLLPIYLIVGIVIPLILCRWMQKRSVVERLHVME